MTALNVANRMVWRLAKQCRNDDVLIVGVATPVAAAAGLLARELLVPDLTLIVGASVQPSTHDISRVMVEADFVAARSVGSLGQGDVLDLIQRGGVTLQFVSPAQVDRYGRLNSSEVRRPDGSRLRLPGPLALPDVACLVGRLVAYRAAHSKRFLVDHVEFVTGMGPADRHERSASRVSGRGVVTVVTDLAVLRLHPQTARVSVESVAPGVSVDEVVTNCGFPLDIPADLTIEEPPPVEAIALLDSFIDPHGIRGVEVPATRAGARAHLDRLSA